MPECRLPGGSDVRLVGGPAFASPWRSGGLTAATRRLLLARTGGGRACLRQQPGGVERFLTLPMPMHDGDSLAIELEHDRQRVGGLGAAALPDPMLVSFEHDGRLVQRLESFHRDVVVAPLGE